MSKFCAARWAKRHPPCGVAGKLRWKRPLRCSRAARPPCNTPRSAIGNVAENRHRPGSIAGQQCNVRGCRALRMLPENSAHVAARPNPSSNHALWSSRVTEKCMFRPAALWRAVRSAWDNSRAARALAGRSPWSECHPGHFTAEADPKTVRREGHRSVCVESITQKAGSMLS